MMKRVHVDVCGLRSKNLGSAKACANKAHGRWVKCAESFSTHKRPAQLCVFTRSFKTELDIMQMYIGKVCHGPLTHEQPTQAC